MPADRFALLPRRADLPALALPPTPLILTPCEASMESRLAAIEARLKREDDERASWERLKIVGLVLAAQAPVSPAKLTMETPT